MGRVFGRIFQDCWRSYARVVVRVRLALGVVEGSLFPVAALGGHHSLVHPAAGLW